MAFYELSEKDKKKHLKEIKRRNDAYYGRIRNDKFIEFFGNLYIVRAAKHIYAKCTTNTAKMKTKAWLWGALAGACVFNLLQIMAVN